MSIHTDTLLLIFVAATGVAVLLQAVVLLAIYLAMRKTTAMLQEQLDELRASVMPVVTGTQRLLTSVGPHIESVVEDMAEMAKSLRAQNASFQSSATEILARIERQAGRVDAMFTTVLDTVDRASSVVVDTINTPLRQLSGIAAFAKAALGAFRSVPSVPRPTHSAADKDMFV